MRKRERGQDRTGRDKDGRGGKEGMLVKIGRDKEEEAKEEGRRIDKGKGSMQGGSRLH